ncbi:hypothetical protein [Sphingobium sp. D43FB]|uniref:hypothetical protein n=1 Tax=Sphingobium sp. D43FB TaxID=2017595 RepID=UPI000BB53C7A|nr:hypothetical protein [Sphingobium sp. D43FB]PBN41247.1 hypothetical protein SxD43FB_22870 [Sphingobium sp. D43FB]
MGIHSDIDTAEALAFGDSGGFLALQLKLSKFLKRGRGGRLSPEELGALVACGAYEALAAAATEQVKKWHEQSARSRSTSAAPIASTDARGAPTLKSSGTTLRPNANEALARAQAMLGKAARP